MQPNDVNTGQTSSSGGDLQPLPIENVVPAPESPLSNGIPYDPNAMSVPTQQVQQRSFGKRPSWRVWAAIAAVVLIAGVAWFLSSGQGAHRATPVNLASQFDTVQLPLDDLTVEVPQGALAVREVNINGQLEIAGSLVLAPSLQPSTPQPGQLYYDQDSNLLGYYNGTEFLYLNGTEDELVNQIGGLSGQVGLGAGLVAAGGQLVNTGVLSVGGQAGAIVLGNGLSLAGNVLQNNGVVDLDAGSGITITDNGGGSFTIINTGAGSGTVASSGGTIGRIPVFTASQNIEDSLVSQSGLTVTVNGGLSVTGSLSLTNALTVANGGTGATSLAANGVLVGNGTGSIAAVTAGGPNLCLLSTAGAPTFAACPSASGVTSLNTLGGDVAIQGTAGQIVVNDNGSDTVTLSLGTDVTLQGNTFNGANQLVQLNASSQLPAVSGALLTNLNGTSIASGTVANARLVNGGELTVTAGTNLTGGGDVALGGSVTLHVTDNPTLAGNVVVQGGTATLGTTSQAGSIVVHDGNGQTTTLQAGNSTGDLTFILPNSAGNVAQCLKQGGSNQLIWDDCEGGTGGISGVTSLNALEGALSLQGTANRVTISDDGNDTITISVPQDIHTAANPTFAGLTLTGNITAQGGTATLGTTSQSGGIAIHDGNGQTTTLQAGNSSGNLAFILPVDAGTGFQCLKKGTGNQLIWDDCEGGGGPGGVTSVNGLIADVTIQGTASQIAVNDNGSDTITLSLDSAVTLQGNTFNGADQLVRLNSDGELPVLSAVNLTDLNASELATGTVPSGVVSGTYAGITGVGTIATGTWQGTTIALDYGGTGATTQQGAINNLAGLTTQGDLLYHNGTNVVRLARGGDGDCLVSTATSIQWGSCLGGGAITGSGTPGAIAVFTDTDELGDSLISQDTDTGVITVDGHLNLASGNQFRINGTQISSANLSNDSNLAKLNTSQTFTGNSNAFRNGSDSTNAFSIQNAAGVRVLTINTTAGQLELGVGSTLSGSLVFNNASDDNTVTILTDALTDSRTILLPDADGVICLDSGNCTGVGDVLQGGNSFGTTMTIGTNDNNDLVLERNNAARLTIGANDITLASGIDLLLQGAGAVISNPQGTSSSEVFGAGASTTANNNVIIGNSADGGAGQGSVVIGSQAETDDADDSVAIGFQAACINNGCIAIGSGASAGFSSLALGVSAAANNDAAIALGEGATTGANNSIALGVDAATTAGNQLVIGSDSTAIMHAVIGNGVTNASPTGFVLQGTSGSGSNVAGASVTIAGGQGTGNADGGDINLQIAAPGSSGSSLNSLATVLQLSGENGAVTIQNAADSDAAFRILDQAGTSVALGVDHDADFVWSDYDLSVNAALDAVDVIVYDELFVEGASYLYGDVTVGDDEDSTTAFRVLDGDSAVVLQVDTTNHRVHVGNPSADSTGALLVLDTKNTSGDPSGENGAMYYNSNTGKFRCYEGGMWADCLGGGVYSDALPTILGDMSGQNDGTDDVTFNVSSVPNGSWMLIVVAFSTSNADGTTPDGWTTIVQSRDFGTRGFLVVGKIKDSSDTTVNIEKGATTAFASYALVYGSGGSHPSQWQVGPAKVRNESPTESVTTTSPSITTVLDNTLAVGISAEATIAAEGGSMVTSGTGWSNANNVVTVTESGSNIEQIRIAAKDMPTAGATNNMIVTYPNSQVNNGIGIQIGITPAVGYFVGATSVTNGKAGFVPAPMAGEQGSVLIGDGTWSDALNIVSGDVTVTNSLFLDGIGTVGGTQTVLCIDSGTGEVLMSATSTDCSTSSARFKQNIADLPEEMGLELISALRPVTFAYINGDGSTKLGLIAEEVAEVLPEVVAYDEEGLPYAINYDYLIANLIKGIQQQQVEIEMLRQAVLHGGLLEISGHIRVGSDTAGTVVIPAGQTSATVTFSEAYQVAPKITTSSSDFVLIKVSDKTTTGFTVSIVAPQATEIRIDWTALEVH